jgi:hypothetical protein
MDVDLRLPPDPDLTPERQLMVEIGWLKLWHALREESAGEPAATGELTPYAVRRQTSGSTTVELPTSRHRRDRCLRALGASRCPQHRRLSKDPPMSKLKIDYGICECACGAPGWRTTRLGAGNPT